MRAKDFQLPTFSWPLAVCLSAAVVIAAAPGCEDATVEAPGPSELPAIQSDLSEPAGQDGVRGRPLFEEIRGRDGPEPAVSDAGRIDPIFVEDPLRLPHGDDPNVDQLKEGQAALDRGDHAAALVAFRKAAFDTESYEAFFGIARAARAAGDVDLALEALGAAAEADAFLAEPLVMAARLAQAQGDVDMGLRYIARAIEREPYRADAHNVRGRLWMAKEQYHRAILAFEAAIEHDPDFVWAFNNKGFVHLLMGDHDAAVESLEAAVKRAPVTAYMLNNLGLAYEGTGRILDAQDAFAEALKIRPGYVNARINLDRIEPVALAEREAIVSPDPIHDGPRVLEDDSLEYVPGG
jgi:tetratricopeptide (TPR) repeat protein